MSDVEDEILSQWRRFYSMINVDCTKYGMTDQQAAFVWRLGIATWREAIVQGAQWPAASDDSDLDLFDESNRSILIQAVRVAFPSMAQFEGDEIMAIIKEAVQGRDQK